MEMEPSRELKGSMRLEIPKANLSLYNCLLGRLGKTRVQGSSGSHSRRGRPWHTSSPPCRASLYPLLGAPDAAAYLSFDTGAPNMVELRALDF